VVFFRGGIAGGRARGQTIGTLEKLANDLRQIPSASEQSYLVPSSIALEASKHVSPIAIIAMINLFD